MNSFNLEVNKPSQEEIDTYQIDMSCYPKLSDIKFLPLSVSNEKVERFLKGKWIVFEGNSTSTEKNMIEFGEDNAIKNSTIKKWRGYDKPDWEFEDHKFGNYTSFNSFNVNGMSTMEIIYIDEYLIYARGYANKDIIFIKEDSIGKFKDLRTISNYLYNRERYWVDLYWTFNDKHQSEFSKESLVGIWLLLFLCSLPIILLAQNQSSFFIFGLLCLVGIVIAVALVIYYKLRQNTLLRKYIAHYKDTDTSILLQARLSGKF